MNAVQFYRALTKLTPLAVPHFSWPIRAKHGWPEKPTPTMIELARVLGSWPLTSLNWANLYGLEPNLQVCKMAGVPGALQYSPIHPTYPDDDNPDPHQELEMAGEMEEYSAVLGGVARRAEKVGVEIGMIFLDHEKLFTSRGRRDAMGVNNRWMMGTPVGAAWDAAIAYKLQIVQTVTDGYIPRAKQAWYPCPDKHRGQGYLMDVGAYYTGGGLYSPTQPHVQQRNYWRLYERCAQKYPEEPVRPMMPCVAVGAGYDPDKDGAWRRDWDYSEVYDELMADFLRENQQFALKAVYLYPAPYNTEIGRRHLVEYLRGWQD